MLGCEPRGHAPLAGAIPGGFRRIDEETPPRYPGRSLFRCQLRNLVAGLETPQDDLGFVCSPRLYLKHATPDIVGTAWRRLQSHDRLVSRLAPELDRHVHNNIQ